MVTDLSPTDIGANPSAEGGDEGGDDEGTETVNNVVYSFRLSPSSFDKKSYKVYLGGESIYPLLIHFPSPSGSPLPLPPKHH